MHARAKIREEPLVQRRARNLWTPQAIKMLAAFVRTGHVKNLRAAQRHIAGILQWLNGGKRG